MGIVYLASRGSRSVALKVLNPGSLDIPEHRGRFVRETDALRSIDSPNVAKVIDAGADGDLPWLAVEFINGPDLRSWVEDRGSLSRSDWQQLAEGLLKGLVAIHDKGLIHRDIKPANILMSESGPKIIDFGIAQDLDATSVTMTGTVAGSPAWLSPEQIDGISLTPATDIFSLGSVLAFAATGESPWGNQSTTTSAVFNRILNKEPSLENLPEEQKLFIEKLLAKVPADRPSSKKATSLLPKAAWSRDEQREPATKGLSGSKKLDLDRTKKTKLFDWTSRVPKILMAKPKDLNRRVKERVEPNQSRRSASEKYGIQKREIKPPKPDIKSVKPARNPLELDPKAKALTKTATARWNSPAIAIAVVGALVIGTALSFTLDFTNQSGSKTAATSECRADSNNERCMPNFKGKSVDEVKDFLISIGIIKWKDIEVASSIKKGLVASTSPGPGDIINLDYWNKYENEIKIFVSNGKGDTTTSQSFTAGGVTMGQTGAFEENGKWGFTELTVQNDILRIPVEVTFTQSTTVFYKYDCSILINGTFEFGCGIPNADYTKYPGTQLYSIPFEVSLEGGIKKPEMMRISFKIEDSRGIRDMNLDFRIAYWE
jgi:serine/threonine protein kinase